jgi:hypothetical protein
VTVLAAGLAGHIADAQREVTFLEDKYAGLRDGTTDWREWDESLTCPDRQQTAVVECGMALDDARRELAALIKQEQGQTGEQQ